jgi:hypothetical protein
MYKNLLKDTKMEEKLLKTDLTSNGINSEWFINNCLNVALKHICLVMLKKEKKLTR